MTIRAAPLEAKNRVRLEYAHDRKRVVAHMQHPHRFELPAEPETRLLRLVSKDELFIATKGLGARPALDEVCWAKEHIKKILRSIYRVHN